MKALLIARKTLLEVWREPQTFILILVFPLAMMLIIAFGYGAGPRLRSYPILVQVLSQSGEEVIAQIEAAQYLDGRPMFTVQRTASLAEANAALKDKSAAVFLVIQKNPTGKIRLEILGDATSMDYTQASVLLEDVLTPLLYADLGKPRLITFEEKPLLQQGPYSLFDCYAPGMMVMAVLFLIPWVAMLLGRELRWGTLRRLRLTLVDAPSLLTGVSLATILIAVVQVVLMFLFTLALGFNSRGSLGLAISICIVLCFSAIGFGLVVSGMSQDDSQAVNIGSVFTMLQVFFSGAFFTMPHIPLFSLAGYSVGVFDFIPATHGLLALQQVLTRGASLEQVWFRVALTFVLSLAYFGLGMVLFQKYQMKRG